MTTRKVRTAHLWRVQYDNVVRDRFDRPKASRRRWLIWTADDEFKFIRRTRKLAIAAMQNATPLHEVIRYTGIAWPSEVAAQMTDLHLELEEKTK